MSETDIEGPASSASTTSNGTVTSTTTPPAPGSSANNAASPPGAVPPRSLANPPTPPRRPQSEDERAIDALFFRKDLNEVHLLIDLVSGRPDRSLSTLAMPDPDQPTRTMSAEEVLKRISLMRYPPNDTDAVNATNAAILLVAKDRLSALSEPARGMTIAYTWMFIDAGTRDSWARLGSLLQRHPTSEPNAAQPERHPGIYLARTTFPELRPHARRFRFWRSCLGMLAILWLALTAFTFWDANLGRSALEHADQNSKAYEDAARDNPELLELNGGCDIQQHIQEYKKASTASPAVAPPPGNGTATPVAPAKSLSDLAKAVTACRKIHSANALKAQSHDAIATVFTCKNMRFTRIVHVWCWHWILSDNFAEPSGQDDQTWQEATSVLAIYTGYVLPMMFALLGTLIGAFRAILNKLGNSSLSPRDMVGMLLGIPAGLVAGVAIGLFLSPSTTPLQGSGNVAGTFTLTASGLGFLAGYASQAFFNYLDSLVGTVFPIGSGATPRASTTNVTTVHQPPSDAPPKPAGPNSGGSGGSGGAADNSATSSGNTVVSSGREPDSGGTIVNGGSQTSDDSASSSSGGTSSESGGSG